MAKKYSYDIVDKIEAKIPQAILDALKSQGWNALGIYELVKDEIKQAKKKTK